MNEPQSIRLLKMQDIKDIKYCMISFIWHLEERQTGDREWTAIAQGWGGRKENIGRLVSVTFKKFHFNF